MKPATYKKLLKFASQGGSVALIGTIVGSLDEKVIQQYLNHMKTADPDVFKSWGSKWKPEEEEADPTADLDDVDPTADLDDADPTADLDDDPTADLEDEPAAPAKPAPVKTGGTVVAKKDKDGNQMIMVPGMAMPIPEKFRLRGPDGLNTDLAVFSRTPKGYILEVPVVRDIRKLTVKGKEITVDLLALQRDPDGMTEGVANSKLIVLAELQDV